MCTFNFAKLCNLVVTTVTPTPLTPVCRAHYNAAVAFQQLLQAKRLHDVPHTHYAAMPTICSLFCILYFCSTVITAVWSSCTRYFTAEKLVSSIYIWTGVSSNPILVMLSGVMELVGGETS